MKSKLKNELHSWTKFEIFWLLFSTLVTVILSIYWKDNLMGIATALTGIWCVILTGKGKRSSFLIGLVNVVLYAIVAYKAKYYGEVMLNVLYYLPMGIVGWFMWKKHMNEETGEVNKACLPTRMSLILYPATAGAIVAYGYLLKWMGGKLPFVDSMSTVISVVAQILSVFRLAEQWILWIVVDIATVVLWAVNFAQGQENIATLIMWSIYLINAFIMYFKWYKESHKA